MLLIFKVYSPANFVIRRSFCAFSTPKVPLHLHFLSESLHLATDTMPTLVRLEKLKMQPSTSLTIALLSKILTSHYRFPKAAIYYVTSNTPLYLPCCKAIGLTRGRTEHFLSLFLITYCSTAYREELQYSVYTEHDSFQYIFNFTDSTSRLAHRDLRLSEFENQRGSPQGVKYYAAVTLFR